MSEIRVARTDSVQSDHGQTNVNTAYGPKVGVGVLLIDERGRILLTLRKRPLEATRQPNHDRPQRRRRIPPSRLSRVRRKDRMTRHSMLRQRKRA